MSNAKMMVQGNLALALDTPMLAARPAGFTVVEGFGPKHPASANKSLGMQPATTAPACAPRPALRTIVLVALAALVALSLVLATFTARSVAYADSVAAVSFQSIDVKDGDTLWNIASSHPVENLTTQETVKLIEQKNNLDSPMLRTGQTLEVPVLGVSK